MANHDCDLTRKKMVGVNGSPKYRLNGHLGDVVINGRIVVKGNGATWE